MWIITKETNYSEDLPSRIGVRSFDCPNEIDVKNINEVKKHMPYRFRTLSDDDEVDFEGYSSSNDDDDAFAPLDDLAMPDVGSTSIQYWVSGKGGGWETL